MLGDSLPLPQTHGEQQRREKQIDKVVRHQDDAEGYHHEAYEDKRGVDAESTTYLVAGDAQQQRDKYDGEKPRILHQQTAS